MKADALIPKKKVVIADDHQIVREGTKQVVQTIPHIEIVAEADNGLAAIAAVKSFTPDLLILDAAMPHAHGIEVFGEARRWSPTTRVTLMTGFTSIGLLSNWLHAGVEGMLLKTSSSEQMRDCFVAVLDGGNYITPDILELLKNNEDTQELTQREREVMALVVSGKTNVEIGGKLHISVKTVEKHRGSLMRKLGVKSVADLMVVALKEGWLDGHKQL